MQEDTHILPAALLTRDGGAIGDTTIIQPYESRADGVKATVKNMKELTLL